MAFLLGVVLLILGFALLVMGAMTLPGNRKLRALPARLAGLVLMAYLPAIIGLRFLLDNIDKEGQLNTDHWAVRFKEDYLPAMIWTLLATCVLLCLFVMWFGSRDRTKKARPQRRSVAMDAAAPAFEDDVAAAPPPEPWVVEPPPAPPKVLKGKAPPRQEKNPFEF